MSTRYSCFFFLLLLLFIFYYLFSKNVSSPVDLARGLSRGRSHGAAETTANTVIARLKENQFLGFSLPGGL